MENKLDESENMDYLVNPGVAHSRFNVLSDIDCEKESLCWMHANDSNATYQNNLICGPENCSYEGIDGDEGAELNDMKHKRKKIEG
jgi:hypothetical protein